MMVENDAPHPSRFEEAGRSKRISPADELTAVLLPRVSADDKGTVMVELGLLRAVWRLIAQDGDYTAGERLRFDVTKPQSTLQDGLLAVLVLDRFADAKGPFTRGDASRVAEAINALIAEHAAPARPAPVAPDLAAEARALKGDVLGEIPATIGEINDVRVVSGRENMAERIVAHAVRRLAIFAPGAKA